MEQRLFEGYLKLGISQLLNETVSYTPQQDLHYHLCGLLPDIRELEKKIIENAKKEGRKEVIAEIEEYIDLLSNDCDIRTSDYEDKIEEIKNNL